MKKVYIIHGWGGTPDKEWFPWLKKELITRGFEVVIPAMPHTELPTIDDWVSFLQKTIIDSDKNTFFVGHSIGCQTIMRYLESLPTQHKVGGVVFVAGWFVLDNLSTEESAIAKPWIDTPIDCEKVISHFDDCVAIFSDNDDWVGERNHDMFAARLNAKIILEPGKKHFSSDDGITELPSVLEVILKMAS